MRFNHHYYIIAKEGVSYFECSLHEFVVHYRFLVRMFHSARSVVRVSDFHEFGFVSKHHFLYL